MSNILEGAEVLRNTVPHTQVYMATHDGADNRLLHMNRSFISFTYGGKNIEDFSFISTITGDRMERNLYSNFNDNTSTYDVLDGQFYWGTHFTNGSLKLTLSTDEVTEKELNDFKRQFMPGPPKELILAESPNRGIMARIASVPQYHMLPFEKQIEKKVAGQSRTISTTVYRGSIDLEFVMDDPFWYSLKNILPSSLRNIRDEWVSTVNDPESLKMILEDGVPTQAMLESSNILTGGEQNAATTILVVGGDNYSALEGQKVAQVGDFLYRASVVIRQNLDGAAAYLYYAGNAPAPTQLSFSISPTITGGYIQYPLNSIANKKLNGNGNNDYNKICVGLQEFQFTTPSIYTGYNQAMDTVTSITDGFSIIDLRILLNDTVKEYYSRSWAYACINYLEAKGIGVNSETSTISKANFVAAFTPLMRLFLPDDATAAFKFNSKTGEATGTFNVRKLADNYVASSNSAALDAVDSSSIISVTENVGDMVYNKYLYLNDRNYINDDGMITENDCTPINTDYPSDLNDFELKYKYMYL